MKSAAVQEKRGWLYIHLVKKYSVENAGLFIIGIKSMDATFADAGIL